jgi:hypothetical protein
MDLQLTGKTAVVTGASMGLDAAVKIISKWRALRDL